MADKFKNRRNRSLKESTTNRITPIGDAYSDYTGGGIYVAYMPIRIDSIDDGTPLEISYDSESLLGEPGVLQFSVVRKYDNGAEELETRVGEDGVFVFDENSEYAKLFYRLKDALIKDMKSDPLYYDLLTMEYPLGIEDYPQHQESLKEGFSKKVSIVEKFLDDLGYGYFHDSHENNYGDVEVRFDSLEDKLSSEELFHIKREAREQLGSTIEFETDGRFTTLIFFGGKLDESLKESEIEFDDDLVVVIAPNGQTVYKGIEDYEPMKGENWKYDYDCDCYRFDGYTKYKIDESLKEFLKESRNNKDQEVIDWWRSVEDWNWKNGGQYNISNDEDDPEAMYVAMWDMLGELKDKNPDLHKSGKKIYDKYHITQ